MAFFNWQDSLITPSLLSFSYPEYNRDIEVKAIKKSPIEMESFVAILFDNPPNVIYLIFMNTE